MNKKEALEMLDKLKTFIENTGETLSEKKEKNIKYWMRRTRVLADVILEGGVITAEKWVEIGKRHGYHPSGLSGFYGGENKTMMKLEDDQDRRTITPYGRKEVKEWLSGEWDDIEPTKYDIEKYAGLKL